MEQIPPAEEVLGLTDSEVLQALENIFGLTQYYSELLARVYRDESLAEQRQALHLATQGRICNPSDEAKGLIKDLIKSVEGEQDRSTVLSILKQGLPAIQEVGQRDLEEGRRSLIEVLPTDLKLIFKVRTALQIALRSIPTPIYYRENEEEYQRLRELVIAMQDGDLAYSTYHWVGGHGAEPVVLETMRYHTFIRDMQFSPELQMEIARGDDAYKAQDLAGNKHLTPEAQLALFNRDDRVSILFNEHATSKELYELILNLEGEEGEDARMRLGLSGREFDEETVQEASKHQRLSLIIKAREDATAELEMIDQAINEENDRWLSFIAIRSRLLSEAAVRKLCEVKRNRLILNKNLQKHPELVAELDITIDSFKQ